MAPIYNDEKRITYFAETDARGKKVRFGIKAEDRTRHVYVIGKTGMGKSTLLENMAAQDIQKGEGMCFIDPHGKTAELLLEYVPKERIRDVIVIAPFDLDNPISFNVLESVDATKRHLVVGGLMSTFKKIWEDAWSARMEYILTNTLLALLEAPNTTLLGVNRMLSDKAYRNEIVSHVTDPSVKSFWVKEFANYTERMAAEAVPAIQNKVGQFTANPLIRNMIGQANSSFDFRKAMDERKIIIINLSKGRIGDENMKLLGGLLVTKIYLAAMSRADVPDRVMKMLPNFYLFVDEFQNFANASFADILSEARKYKLNLTIAHQYIEQMDEIVRPAVFGNVGTMIAFRVGATDAEVFEKEFAPVFVLEDLVNLGRYQLYLKLMIDGLSSTPFSATTLPPIAHPDTSYVNEIIAASREQFSRPRAEVELAVAAFHDSTPAVKKIEALGDREKPSPKVGSASLAAMTKVKPVTETSEPIISKPVIPKLATSSPATSMGTSTISTPAPIPFVRKTITSVPIEKPIEKVSPISVATTPSAPIQVASKPPLEGHSNLKDALLSAVSKPKVEAPAMSSIEKPKLVVEKQIPITGAPKAASILVPKHVIEFKITPAAAAQLSKEEFGLSNPPAPAATISTPQSKVPAPSPILVPKPVVEVQKPVSLSSLAAKPSVPRSDPKMQTKENVNSLKSALAAAMAKKNTITPIPKEELLNFLNGLKSVPKITVTETPVSTETAHTTPRQAPVSNVQNNTPAPTEVPEDVLRGVLKVD